MILPAGIADDPKSVKLIELAAQLGEEVKVDSGPIDRLIGLYNDIVYQGLLTVEEYARGINVSVYECRRWSSRRARLLSFLSS